jgi:hypothetical protein
MAEQSAPKPFDKGFVLGVTAKHIRRDIDVSIRKTFARTGEFMSDPVKSKEIITTLMILHGLRASLDKFQKDNQEHFARTAT